MFERLPAWVNVASEWALAVLMGSLILAMVIGVVLLTIVIIRLVKDHAAW